MIEKFFTTIFASNINIVFFIIMLVLFGIATVVVVLKKDSEIYGFAKATPTLLTSIGILGTFIGIVIALMGFDDNNIKAHINEIIAGMQTAFITSVIGVLLSIILKTIILLSDKNNNSNDIIYYTIELLENQNKTLNDHSEWIKKQSENSEAQSIAINTQTKAILKLLENNEFQKQTFENQAIAIEKLANAIGSDSENSLIGQMTRMRSDMNDNHKNLSKELSGYQQKQVEFFTNLIKSVLKHQADKSEKFQKELFEKLDNVSEIISKSATEQVINALKEVISDFNNNLTEQFGENFKELNRAVFKLVEWQDKYAHQIDTMIKQYEQGVLAIESTKTAVMAIESGTKTIPTTMNNLSEIIKVNQHQIDELNHHLHAFGELQEKATKALPETQKHIELMIKGVDDGAKDIVSGMNDIYQSMSHNLESYNNKIQKDLKENNDLFIQAINDNYKSVSDKFIEYNNGIQKDLRDNNDTIIRGMNDVYISMSRQLTEYNSNIQNDLKESNKKITDAMALFNNGFKQSSDNLNQDLNNINEMIKSQINHSQSFTANLKSHLEQIAKDFESYVKETNQTQLNQMRKLLDGVDKSAQTALSSTGESIEKQIKALQKAQEQELEQIIKVMGQALATITKQFTNDYSKLVNEMDKVIRMHNQKF